MPKESELKLYLAEQRRRQQLWYWQAYYSVQGFFTAIKRGVKQGTWSVWFSIWRYTLGRWIYIKRARVVATEVATIRWVAAQTTIPVPRVWCTFAWRGEDYIAMSRVSGTDIKQRRWRKLPSTVQDHIVRQLATFFAQLRAIPPPPGTAVGSSVLGGPFLDYRVYRVGQSGPYDDEEHLNRELRFGNPLDTHPEPVRTAHSVRHRLVFTHNDIALRNIMVADDNSGRITALIDWECAAWLPDYWEYSKVVNWNWEDRQFKERVSAFLETYEMEAEADRVLSEMYGEAYDIFP